MVKNPSANAGDMGLIPGLEDPRCHGATKPTITTELVLESLRTTATEPCTTTTEACSP